MLLEAQRSHQNQQVEEGAGAEEAGASEWTQERQLNDRWLIMRDKIGK